MDNLNNNAEVNENKKDKDEMKQLKAVRLIMKILIWTFVIALLIALTTIISAKIAFPGEGIVGPVREMINFITNQFN